MGPSRRVIAYDPVSTAHDNAHVTDAQDDPLLPPTLPPPTLATTAALPTTSSWQPLPRRGALLHAAGTAVGFAIPAAIVMAALADQLGGYALMAGLVAGALLGLLLGGAIGLRRHRRMGWKLDQDGFATRRGGLWRSETLVPVSRVQHLDLERGPLERQLGLATLVVHTAGTRMAAVKLPLLALDDAEALRNHLARQVEADDAL